MVKTKSYVPDRGEIVWLTFDPQSGHEQRGRRPALVISPIEYNRKTNLAIFVPITSKVKGYPFEVRLESKTIDGVILSDQIKSLDWNQREVDFIEKISKSVLTEVIENIDLLIK
jgi:mRNA interferase MazF